MKWIHLILRTEDSPVVNLWHDCVEIRRVGPVSGAATRVTSGEKATGRAVGLVVCWDAEMLHVGDSLKNGGCQACFDVPFDVAMDCEIWLADSGRLQWTSYLRN
jgi:hypothetical protein